MPSILCLHVFLSTMLFALICVGVAAALGRCGEIGECLGFCYFITTPRLHIEIGRGNSTNNKNNKHAPVHSVSNQINETQCCCCCCPALLQVLTRSQVWGLSMQGSSGMSALTPLQAGLGGISHKHRLGNKEPAFFLGVGRGVDNEHSGMGVLFEACGAQASKPSSWEPGVCRQGVGAPMTQTRHGKQTMLLPMHVCSESAINQPA